MLWPAIAAHETGFTEQGATQGSACPAPPFSGKEQIGTVGRQTEVGIRRFPVWSKLNPSVRNQTRTRYGEPGRLAKSRGAFFPIGDGDAKSIRERRIQVQTRQSG